MVALFVVLVVLFWLNNSTQLPNSIRDKTFTINNIHIIFEIFILAGLFFWIHWSFKQWSLIHDTLQKKQKPNVIFQHPDSFFEHISGFEYNIPADRFTFTQNTPGIFSDIKKGDENITLDVFLDHIPEHNKQNFFNKFRTAINDKIPFTIEFYIDDKQKGEQIISLKARVFLNNIGEPEYVSGSTQNITEYKRTEEALRIYEDQLREARTIASIGTWFYDIKTDKFKISEEALYILGVEAQSLAPFHFRNLKKIFPIEQLAQFRQTYKKVTKEKQNFDLEYTYQHPDGKTRIHRTVSSNTNTTDGQPGYAIGIIQDITLFKETENKILEQKNKLERTQKLAQIAFFDFNWQDKQFFCSQELYQILETSPASEDLFSTIIVNLFPEDVDRVKGHISLPWQQQTTRTGEVEFRIACKNGRLKYLFAQYEHIYNANGEKQYSSGWVQDMTSHRINEMALAESEEKYRNMFALESDGLFLVDNDTGSILETNAAASKLFGYSTQEFRHINVKNLNQNPDILWKQLQQQLVTIDKTLCKTKNNKSFIGMVSLTYFVWKGRNVHLAAFRDITLQKESEKELELTKFILDHSSLMVYVLRADGSFYYTNKALRNTLGYSEIQLSRKKIYDIHPEMKPSDFKTRWLELKKEQKLHFNSPHIDSEKNIIPCEIITNYLNVDGEEYKVAFAQDITTRVEMEEQIRHSEKMNAVGQMAGGIAHDFNNQLMGISGYARLLKERIDTQPLLSYIEQIIIAADHSADLTSKLLAFSRKGKYISIRSNAHELIQECVTLLEPGLGKRIAIHLSLKAINHYFNGDPSSVQNAILNLAINAKDAMPKGGILSITTSNLTITPENKSTYAEDIQVGEYIKIDIIDNGTGIKEEHLEKIFEPFFSTKKKGEGTGLGLSATFGTIKAHNGIITVKSILGKGSTFSIFLLASKQEDMVVANDQEKNITLYGEGKIILVDDEEIVRSITAMMISDLGYEVISFSNGSECLAYYKDNAQQVAAIILDLIMPGMSGYEVFKKLKAINPEVKVLIFSGFSADNEAQKAIDEGAAGYLQKPANKKSLSQQLAKIAGSSGLKEQKKITTTPPNSLPKTTHADLKKALLLLDGNVSLLENIFMGFYKNYSTAIAKIESLIQSEDMAGLFLMAHSVKTLASNMGATKLSKCAANLEQELDSPTKINFHKSKYLPGFKEQLTLLISDLKSWDKITEAAPTKLTTTAATDNRQLEILKKCVSLIQQYSPRYSKEIFDLIHSVSWATKLQPELNDLLSAVEDYDFELAEKNCKNLLNNFNSYNHE